MTLAAVMAWALAGSPSARAQDEYGDASLRGAGSTFVQPLMATWVGQYRTDPWQVLGTVRGSNGGLGDRLSNDGLDYEPVGSLAGIQRIRAGFVDFAATEMPLPAEYLTKNGLVQFPWVAGAVAIVATVRGDGVAGAAPLRLDASTLAAIFLGRIRRWSDPAIVAHNPGRSLPDAPITVIHRSDGSGTTFTFASWLANHDPDWKQQVGADLLLKWPVGAGQKGTDGVIRALRTTPNAIGYVNAVQARQAALPVVALRNAAGHFLPPDPATVKTALAELDSASDPGKLRIDAAGDGSYPLVATVFGLVRTPLDSARQRRTAEFIAWTLTRGRGLADHGGYASLPEPVARATIARLTPALP